MYFRKIEFQNYKSIQEPVVLSLDRDLPTILIGKNGSGKTNLLEAIEKIISANTESDIPASARGKVGELFGKSE